MVVAFHFEYDTITVTDIDNAGIFTGPLDDLWAIGWQCCKPDT